MTSVRTAEIIYKATSPGEPEDIPQVRAIKQVTGLEFEAAIDKATFAVRLACANSGNCDFGTSVEFGKVVIDSTPASIIELPDNDIEVPTATIEVACGEADCPSFYSCAARFENLGNICIEAVEAADVKADEIVREARSDADALLSPAQAEAAAILQPAQAQADAILTPAKEQHATAVAYGEQRAITERYEIYNNTLSELGFPQ